MSYGQYCISGLHFLLILIAYGKCNYLLFMLLFLFLISNSGYYWQNMLKGQLPLICWYMMFTAKGSGLFIEQTDVS
jgi:hypothetical protein